MLNIIIAFAAGAAISALVGLYEKSRIYREAGALLLLSKQALEQAKEDEKKDADYIRTLRAEIRELTRFR
jgi:hypothetical protein